jgi:accessory gene regulator B
MLERLANRWTDFLIAKGADPENKEVYAYALEYILSSVVSYGILLILAAVFNLVPQMLLFFLFWIPLRSNFGGVHASSQAMCLVLSAIFGVGSVFLAVNFIPDILVILICSAVCILMTFLIAPVMHPNHPVTKERLHHIKKVVRAVILVECALCIAVYFLLPAWVASTGVYSIGFAVLFGLLGKLINKPAPAEDSKE